MAKCVSIQHLNVMRKKYLMLSMKAYYHLKVGEFNEARDLIPLFDKFS